MHTCSWGCLAWSSLCSRQARSHCPPVTALGGWAPPQQRRQGTWDFAAAGLLWRAAVGSGCQMHRAELPLRLQLGPSPAMCSSATAGQGVERGSQRVMIRQCLLQDTVMDCQQSDTTDSPDLQARQAWSLQVAGWAPAPQLLLAAAQKLPGHLHPLGHPAEGELLLQRAGAPQPLPAVPQRAAAADSAGA